LVEVDQGAVTYLFDITAARVVAVYGHSVLPHPPRSAARMRGSPLPPPTAGPLVRGHLIAHAIGGGTDINADDSQTPSRFTYLVAAAVLLVLAGALSALWSPRLS